MPAKKTTKTSPEPIVETSAAEEEIDQIQEDLLQEVQNLPEEEPAEEIPAEPHSDSQPSTVSTELITTLSSLSPNTLKALLSTLVPPESPVHPTLSHESPIIEPRLQPGVARPPVSRPSPMSTQSVVSAMTVDPSQAGWERGVQLEAVLEEEEYDQPTEDQPSSTIAYNDGELRDQLDAMGPNFDEYPALDANRFECFERVYDTGEIVAVYPDGGVVRTPHSRVRVATVRTSSGRVSRRPQDYSPGTSSGNAERRMLLEALGMTQAQLREQRELEQKEFPKRRRVAAPATSRPPATSLSRPSRPNPAISTSSSATVHQDYAAPRHSSSTSSLPRPPVQPAQTPRSHPSVRSFAPPVFASPSDDRSIVSAQTHNSLTDSVELEYDENSDRPAARAQAIQNPEQLTTIQPEKIAEFVRAYLHYQKHGGKLHPKSFVVHYILGRLSLRAGSTVAQVSKCSAKEFLVFLSQFTSQREMRSEVSTIHKLADELAHSASGEVYNLQTFKYLFACEQLLETNTHLSITQFIALVVKATRDETLITLLTTSIGTYQSWDEFMTDISGILEEDSRRHLEHPPTPPVALPVSAPHPVYAPPIPVVPTVVTPQVAPAIPMIQPRAQPRAQPGLAPNARGTFPVPSWADRNRANRPRKVTLTSAAVIAVRRPTLEFSISPVVVHTSSVVIPERVLSGYADSLSDISLVTSKVVEELQAEGYRIKDSKSKISLVVADCSSSSSVTNRYVSCWLRGKDSFFKTRLYECNSLAHPIIVGYSDLGALGRLDLQQQYDNAHVSTSEQPSADICVLPVTSDLGYDADDMSDDELSGDWISVSPKRKARSTSASQPTHSATATKATSTNNRYAALEIIEPQDLIDQPSVIVASVHAGPLSIPIAAAIPDIVDTDICPYLPQVLSMQDYFSDKPFSPTISLSPNHPSHLPSPGTVTRPLSPERATVPLLPAAQASVPPPPLPSVIHADTQQALPAILAAKNREVNILAAQNFEKNILAAKTFATNFHPIQDPVASSSPCTVVPTGESPPIPSIPIQVPLYIPLVTESTGSGQAVIQNLAFPQGMVVTTTGSGQAVATPPPIRRVSPKKQPSAVANVARSNREWYQEAKGRVNSNHKNQKHAQRRRTINSSPLSIVDTAIQHALRDPSEEPGEQCNPTGRRQIRQLLCHSCHQLFDFAIKRQIYFEKRDYQDPSRCFECTQKKRQNCAKVAEFYANWDDTKKTAEDNRVLQVNMAALHLAADNELAVKEMLDTQATQRQLASWYDAATADQDTNCHLQDAFPPLEPYSVNLPQKITEAYDSQGKALFAPLCAEFPTIFDNDLTQGSNIDEQLELFPRPNAQPPHAHRRRQTPADEEVLTKLTTEQLDNHIIEESLGSEWLSNPLVVHQPTKTRVCIDFSPVNKHLEKHHSLIPSPDELFEFTKGKKYLAKFDLTSGYHQFFLHPNSRKYTAFQTSHGIYQYIRVPLGIHTAPGFFQRVMCKILHDCTGAMGYFDDILMAADTPEELAANIRKVFENLTRYNIKIKGVKCEIGTSQLEFLGMILSGSGIAVKDTRREVINAWQYPQNQKQLKQFLGFVGFISRFIPNAATLLAPLSDLTGGFKVEPPPGQKFHPAKLKRMRQQRPIPDTKELRVIFQHIKDTINDTAILYHPDPAREFHLKTDASKVGIGAYLYQLVDGEERPICFYSAKLSVAQLKWSVNEKEAYGVYMGVMRFAHHLKHVPFHIHTDHANLRYIKENSAPKIVRWFLRLQQFQFWLDHIPRGQNVVADSLAGAADHKDVQCGLSQIEPKKHFDWSREPLPKAIRVEIAKVHNSFYGHMGGRKTLARVHLNNPASKVTADHVGQYIRECAICQKLCTNNNVTGEARYVPLSNAIPWRTIAMDYLFIGNKDSTQPDSVLTFVDQCSRKVALYATYGETAKQTAEKLIDLFGREGPVQLLKSDNASHFINETIRQFNLLTHTSHLKSIPYKSSSNGIVERANREIQRHLLALIGESKLTVDNWPILLPLVQRCMNATTNIVTGCTPDQMMTGQTKELDADILAPVVTIKGKKVVDLNIQMKMLTEAQATFRERHAKYLQERIQEEQQASDKLVTTVFPVDSLVLSLYPSGRPPTKTTTKWQGPSKIISQEGSVVVLKHCSTGKSMSRHVSKVKPFLSHEPLTDIQLADIAKKDTDEFTIGRISSHVKHGKTFATTHFKIHWDGYETPSWEPWANVRHTEAVEIYAQKAGLKLPPEYISKKDKSIALIPSLPAESFLPFQ